MTKQLGLGQQPSSRVSRISFLFLAASMVALSIAPSSAASVPSYPQYVEAMAGPTQVAITWDPPSSNGGESTLNYSARVWTVPPPTSSPVFASCTTTGLGCVVGGLVSGTTYYVDVIASNSAGPGVPSAMKPITPGGTGSPPTNVTATSDNKGVVTIKWTPSTALGTGTFAWYTAEIFTGPEISVGAYTRYCTADPASATSCFVSGLTLGSIYYVQVRTVSSLGSSYPSTPRYKVVAGTSASPIPSGKPSSSSTATSKLSAPLAVKVVALSKSVRVSWKAPAVTGGKKIIGYRAGAFGPAGTLLVYCKTKPTVFICTIPKLQAKRAVYIGVVALYADADSPSSKLIAVIPKS